MGSSCAVQGVVKLKREYLDEVHALYQTPDQGFNEVREKQDITRYLFGVNVSNYIEDHFGEKAANESFNNADFETGYITFVSGFSSYQLEEFLDRIKLISDAYILYSIYESPVRRDNQKALVKNKDSLAAYMPMFNSSEFIESEVPYDDFDIDGEYCEILVNEPNSAWFGNNEEYVWKFFE